MTADAVAGAVPKPVPTWAVITVLSLAGTTVSLQQTMVIPLLQRSNVCCRSQPTTSPGW